jgi:4-hydroxythreonine-4-phosphate dehydrogenase
VVDSASDAQQDRLNVVNCNKEDVKVDFGLPTEESGQAAFQALERAVKEYREGKIDVLVTAPINKKTIHSDSFNFPGHTEYIEAKLGEGNKALMILMNSSMRVALATVHEPIAKVSSLLSKDLIKDKLRILNKSLRQDFGIEIPRIAVLALNPHASDDGLIGKEENEIIKPAIDEAAADKIQCFGPFPADGFFGSGEYRKFDAVLAIYYEQGVVPFRALSYDDGVSYLLGIPQLCVAPFQSVGYEIAGQDKAMPNAFQKAIYLACDIINNRIQYKNLTANVLKKHNISD